MFFFANLRKPNINFSIFLDQRFSQIFESTTLIKCHFFLKHLLTIACLLLKKYQNFGVLKSLKLYIVSTDRHPICYEKSLKIVLNIWINLYLLMSFKKKELIN
ncbi:hypothetical protein BpHYR1_031639 [Brachionus plicatilis]|uniref:Uncharacterized protein n=1 Tax=Brachionus plicatilis TaxID=10195 RepID=A0A3M7S4J8_BRAPC|nr:hypothetical protein BpHYR1_031639 [Brachionus plicatilis]